MTLKNRRRGLTLVPGKGGERMLIGYLLGELNERDRERVEEHYLSDPEQYERLVATESDLIDAYLRGELLPGDRRRFEQHFLTTPERLEKVRFARELLDAADREAPARGAQSSLGDALGRMRLHGGLIGRWVAAASAAALLLAVALLWRDRTRVFTELEQVKGEQAKLGQRVQEAEKRRVATEAPAAVFREEVAGQPSAEPRVAESIPLPEARRPAPAPPIQAPSFHVVGFILSPGLLRGSGESQRLSVPPEASRVRLRLQLDRDEHQSYEAVLLTAEGEEILRRPRLLAHETPEGSAVVLQLPARLLPHGDYTVNLRGRASGGEPEPVADYAFRVVR